MKKTKIYLTDILKPYTEKSYEEQYEIVMKSIHSGEIEPVKSSGLNGRKPALPLSYWKYEEEPDYSDVLEELTYKIHPMLDISYYKAHPDKYAKDRANILLFSEYLEKNRELLDLPETMNERSFEIFRREKFFQGEGGLKLCDRLGIGMDKLNFYHTSEPLAYYSYSKKRKQNILIIENKDTFYELRRYLQRMDRKILGIEFDTVIYGAGKGIWKTFLDYAGGAEEYFRGDNPLFYFGDIDYEGIFIYEKLAMEKWHDIEGNKITIRPYIPAYQAALDKALLIGMEGLPDMKEKQNNNIGTVFFDFFEDERKQQMVDILLAGKYIPQEILNEHDWRK